MIFQILQYFLNMFNDDFLSQRILLIFYGSFDLPPRTTFCMANLCVTGVNFSTPLKLILGIYQSRIKRL